MLIFLKKLLMLRPYPLQVLVLSVQFSGIKYSHITVQPSPSYIPITFHLIKLKLCKTGTPHFPLLPSSASHHCTSCLYDFDYSKYLI